MTSALRRDDERRPLVAVVCSVPLLGEAVSAALEFAEVRTFAASSGGVAGLLRSLRPDAVVVDGEDAEAAAIEYARNRELPVVHICMRSNILRVFRRGEWESLESDVPTPEAIRNIIAGALFAREDALL